MPTPPKPSENMTKHATDAEKAARERAEKDTMPDRGGKLKLRKPAFVSHNKVANAYWNRIEKDMKGLVLLDNLDSEMLAGYCAMLARRDQTIILVNQLMGDLGVVGAITPLTKPRKKKDADLSDVEFEESAHRPGAGKLGPDEIVEAADKLDKLSGRLQGVERNLLTYADKLGLTPSGRVRLAQKRAEKAENVEPDDDLYG